LLLGENEMAIETFTWRTQGQPEGSFNQRVRVAKFGDGYEQVAADGINPEQQTWSLSFNGIEKEMIPILSFLRRHVIKSFIWTPPYGERGLYRIASDSIKATPIGGKTMTVSATFEQAYAP